MPWRECTECDTAGRPRDPLADQCAACRGTRRVWLQDAGPCRRCGGKGTVFRSVFAWRARCPACRGTGTIGTAPPRWTPPTTT
ncbi:MAG TPA: hypothetical protein VGF55_25215 [Gemmataceae bacterium]